MIQSTKLINNYYRKGNNPKLLPLIGYIRKRTGNKFSRWDKDDYRQDEMLWSSFLSIMGGGCVFFTMFIFYNVTGLLFISNLIGFGVPILLILMGLITDFYVAKDKIRYKKEPLEDLCNEGGEKEQEAYWAAMDLLHFTSPIHEDEALLNTTAKTISHIYELHENLNSLRSEISDRELAVAVLEKAGESISKSALEEIHKIKDTQTLVQAQMNKAIDTILKTKKHMHAITENRQQKEKIENARAVLSGKSKINSSVLEKGKDEMLELQSILEATLSLEEKEVAR